MRSHMPRTTTTGRTGGGIFAPALLSLAALAAGGCDATQPRPLCRAQSAQYAARYTVQGTPQGACDGKVLTGEILNLQYYRSPPGDAAGTASLAIEPESVFQAVKAGMATGMEYSIGRYTAVEPDAANLCKAPTLSETSITMGTTAISYKWSNMEMMVMATSNAIHFGGDLVRKEGDCTVNYKVSAVYPALHCGDGVDQMGMPDPTTGKPNPAACEPVTGSGLSPDLAYACDASADGTSGTRLCVPAKAFPAFK